MNMKTYHQGLIKLVHPRVGKVLERNKSPDTPIISVRDTLQPITGYLKRPKFDQGTEASLNVKFNSL